MEKIGLLAICLTLIGAAFASASDIGIDKELRILPEKLPAGKVGMEYGFKLEANCDCDLKWEISGLPEGMKADHNAIIGAPKKEGGYEVVAYVTDGSREAKKSFKLTITKDILPPPPATPPVPETSAGMGSKSRKELEHGKITIQHFLNLNEKLKEFVRAEAYRILRLQLSEGQNIDSYTTRLLYVTGALLND